MYDDFLAGFRLIGSRRPRGCCHNPFTPFNVTMTRRPGAVLSQIRFFFKPVRHTRDHVLRRRAGRPPRRLKLTDANRWFYHNGDSGGLG